jgi:hypothetical protein
MQDYNKQGQILIITLLTLFILSIIVLSTTIVTTRDVQERVYSEVYEENYLNAESRLLQTYATFKEKREDVILGTSIISDIEASLSESLYDDPAFDVDCTVAAGINSYTCTLEDDEITTEVDFTIDNEVENMQISSEDVLQLDLRIDASTSYTGPIRLSWDSADQVIWSIGIIYERDYAGSIEYDITKDVYDGIGATSRSSAASVLSFSAHPDTSISSANGFELSLNPATFATNHVRNVYLRLRPIIINSEKTAISLYGLAELPAQFIDITSQAYRSGLGESTPTPLLSVKAPLHPAPPALFDYVYYQNNNR